MTTIEHAHCQVLVLGGGPAGYACAIRAAQLGLDTMLVEHETVGGTCLHAGCIPSKALIHVAERYRLVAGRSDELSRLGLDVQLDGFDWARALAWKQSLVDGLAGGVTSLLKRAGVQIVHGHGEMQDGKRCRVARAGTTGDTTNEAAVLEICSENVVLATGSTEVTLPGLEPGEHVLYARQILSIDALPKRLVVVGAGYIGLELGQAFARLGSEVTVVEAASRILPLWDEELTRPVARALENEGVTVRLDCRARAFGDGLLDVESDGTGSARLEADKVLVAAGRRARLDGWGIENLAIGSDDGYIDVDERCQSSMTDVYAIGDLTGGPMLAHRAIAQAALVAEVLAGRRRRFHPVAIPAVCFTSPEVVSVGLTPEQASTGDAETLVSTFSLSGNARALTLGDGTGFIRVVARDSDHVLLGIQAVGNHVAELAHEFTLALEMGARLEDLTETIHAHPTVGESVAEASSKALGLPMHG